jgi:hypothetical protein
LNSQADIATPATSTAGYATQCMSEICKMDN